MDLVVGSRVLVLQDKGTVRYIGSVSGQKGTWVGIEWDDPSRGKHDGSTGGVTYFTCEHPTGGSFIRREKVTAGISLLEALKSRYHNEVGDYGSSVGEEAMYLQTSSKRVLRVELVGMEKVQQHQAKLDMLKTARLVGLRISSAGDLEALREAAPELHEVDLTDNLISFWSTVEQIFQGLPRLTFLDLSQNRVDLSPVGQTMSFQSLTALQGLVLNRCGVTWQQVLRLQDSLPNLRELHLCGNSISSLAPQEPLPPNLLHTSAFRALQVLDLEENELSQWEDIELLSSLPNLSRLHLSHNPVPRIHYPTTVSTTTPAATHSISLSSPSPPHPSLPFPQLEALFMGHCALTQWRCIDELDKFPKLLELRVSDNPLVQDARSGGRFEVIGRVGGLTMLNGAAVNSRERWDGEIRYLQSILADFPAVATTSAKQLAAAAAAVACSCGGSGGAAEAGAASGGAAAGADGGGAAAGASEDGPNRWVVLHPRLPLLREKYGAVCSTAARPAHQGTTMVSTSVSLQLTLPSTGKTLKKKIPRSITVGNLKILLEKLFKVPVANQQLMLKEGGGEGLDIGGDESQQLSFFSVEDGWVVEVHDVDPEEWLQQQQESKRKEASDHQQRLTQQLRAGQRMQEAAQNL